MGLEEMHIFVYRNKEDALRNFPEDLDQVDHEPCTAKAICYNTAVIGGIITSIVKKIIKGEEYPHTFILDLKTYSMIKKI